MNKYEVQLKNIIKYLSDVNCDKEIGPLDQNFFIPISFQKDSISYNESKSGDQNPANSLKDLLRYYFQYFENEKKLKESVEHNLDSIKEFSFKPKADYKVDKNSSLSITKKIQFQIFKDLETDNEVIRDKQFHNNYSYYIHFHLVKEFEKKLGNKKVSNKKTNYKRITIRPDSEKKVIQILNKLNLTYEFLRSEDSPEDLISVLKGSLEKKIVFKCNTNFIAYILHRLNNHFLTYNMELVANTDKLFSKKENPLKAKNLNQSKENLDYKLKQEIDSFF